MVIFVTAYNQFAIAAIRANALDYILKPVGHKQLIPAVNKALKLHHRILKNKGSYEGHIDVVNHFINDLESYKGEITSIVAPLNKSYERVDLSKILYLKASNNYTIFVQVNSEEFIVAKTLKEYSEILENSQFIRIHKSYLINMSHIKCLDSELAEKIIMSNGDILPISRRRRDYILQAIYTKN